MRNRETLKDVAAPRVDMDVSELQHRLLERICMRHYKPGDQLKEAELAREFGVSRTPVREALNRISHLGLISTRNGVGTVVVSLSLAQIEQVYELRLELACLIGTLSPIVPDTGHLEKLTALLTRAKAMQLAFDADDYIRINHELNMLIATMIGNQILRATWLHTYYQAASTWHGVADALGADVVAALIEELTDLVAAVCQGDAKAVGYTQRIHIGYGFAKVRRQFA
ncbi:MAG: GntR family transcriptional regulator [Pseudorhodobacter sp.]|nr:GntR family transcriptional regulator [Pseudorhodobacter sp.]